MSKRPRYDIAKYDLRETQRKALKAYVDSFGNISKACREAGVERQSWYHWVSEDAFKVAREGANEEIKRRKEVQDEHRVGVVEDALYESAKAGKENSMMFFLKNRAADRWRNDYIQGQVYIQNNKNTLNFVQTQVGDLSNRELLDEARKLTDRIQQLRGKEDDIEIEVEGRAGQDGDDGQGTD